MTVLDDEYPSNLRAITNLPPFLMVRGRRLCDDDARSVAVVGTRRPSTDGKVRAARMSRELADAGVGVVSGLAAGVDAIAHRCALDAHGSTIAVIGTGIATCYPVENSSLSDEIAERGILVSQFWPRAGPTRLTFPKRNVVMSGMAQGTLVIEAGVNSGAKLQARIAGGHGKLVFLPFDLVERQQWARDFVAERGAIEVEDALDVINLLVEPGSETSVVASRQLTLDLS